MKNKKTENKKKINTDQILIGIFLLLIGIALGIMISLNGTFALEASTSNNATATNATSSNATSSNATSSNATSSNATSSNATSSNATSSNAQRTDNIIYLNHLSFKSTNVKPEEKVYIEKNTSGACNTAISLTLWNKTNDIKFTVNVEDVNNNPYFIVPKNVAEGEYNLVNVLLIGLNSDNTTFSREYDYTNNKDDNTSISSIMLNIKLESKKDIQFSNLTIEENAIVGENVNVNFSTSESLKSLKLQFKNDDGESFSVYVQNLTSNPYFTIPSETKEGNYSLYQAIFSTDELSTVYTNGQNYNFKCSLNIKNNTTKTFIYNNKDIEENVIKEIYNEESDIDITINANENSIISSELFNAIKGTSKNLFINYEDNILIFNGNDIQTAKSIDVSISATPVKEENSIKELVNEGIILNFASNGNLPGNALIKIKITDDMMQTFNNNKISVYYYNEEENGFNVIAEEISPKDGYYEFIINHNSKYILTSQEINEDLILEEEDNIVHFQQSNNQYLLLICASALLIAVVIAIIFVIKKKRKN